MVLAVTPHPPVPFNETTKKFRKEFGEVINQRKYDALRIDDYKGEFFKQAHLELMEEAWREIARYQRS